MTHPRVTCMDGKCCRRVLQSVAVCVCVCVCIRYGSSALISTETDVEWYSMHGPRGLCSVCVAFVGRCVCLLCSLGWDDSHASFSGTNLGEVVSTRSSVTKHIIWYRSKDGWHTEMLCPPWAMQHGKTTIQEADSNTVCWKYVRMNYWQAMNVFITF